MIYKMLMKSKVQAYNTRALRATNKRTQNKSNSTKREFIPYHSGKTISDLLIPAKREKHLPRK
jgi:hypothetical protein